MRRTAAIMAILCSTVVAHGEEWGPTKLVCTGAHAPSGLRPGATRVLGAGIGNVVVPIPPGFELKKIYCEMYDPQYGLKACKYSKKADGSCPHVSSKAMLIQNFGDGFRNLHWYIDSQEVGRPRTFILSADVTEKDAGKKDVAKGK